MISDHLCRIDTFLNVRSTGNLKHDVKHRALDHAPQTPGTGVPLDRLLGNSLEGGVFKLQIDVSIRKQLLILLGERSWASSRYR